MVHSEVKELEQMAYSSLTAVKKGDLEKLGEIFEKVKEQATEVGFKLMKFVGYIFPFVALLTVILLMYANWAVKDKKGERRSAGTLIYIAIVHVILAIGKFTVFLFPVMILLAVSGTGRGILIAGSLFISLVFFLSLGTYIYVKLFFVSLIMLEEGKRALEAIKLSWKIITGNFWEVFLVVVINIGIQFLSSLTVIGLIPATGFVNTARAAAFRILWEENDYPDVKSKV